MPSIRSWGAPDGPAMIQPSQPSDDLPAWIAANNAEVASLLRERGAILFRGFDLSNPPAFEAAARAITPDLKNDYLGTSPRNALTPYVFTASELPGWYPIPQHCEMTFVREPPRWLHFACFTAPAAGSGETPLCDFRKVLADLDPGLVDRLTRGGLRIVRNYAGPGGSGRFDLWKLKRWDEMFLTADREVVAARCRAEGFEPEWTGAGGLRLISTQPVARAHPDTGAAVWHNHLITFHITQAAGEYRRIFMLRPSFRHGALVATATALERLQRRTPPDARAMHIGYADGSEIADADVEAVREVVWRHMVRIPWERGDMIAIDNYAVSHGRMPYQGPREIAVCWA